MPDDIYSPEASDGAPDWPTLIVCGLLVALGVSLIAWWLL